LLGGGGGGGGGCSYESFRQKGLPCRVNWTWTSTCASDACWACVATDS
jgi:hypothetical protein